MPRYYENYEVIITFDNKTKKVLIADFFSEVTMTSGLFCNPPSFSCIAKIQ